MQVVVGVGLGVLDRVDLVLVNVHPVFRGEHAVHGGERNGELLPQVHLAYCGHLLGIVLVQHEGTLHRSIWLRGPDNQLRGPFSPSSILAYTSRPLTSVKLGFSVMVVSSSSVCDARAGFRHLSPCAVY